MIKTLVNYYKFCIIKYLTLQFELYGSTVTNLVFFNLIWSDCSPRIRSLRVESTKILKNRIQQAFVSQMRLKICGIFFGNFSLLLFETFTFILKSLELV